MKYAIWFVRLVFAAWMIPAGLNHFIPLFPQPMGNQPLSHELIVALLDSHLFDLVKAVELIAGIGVLIAFYTPLSLLICMPVSFCVFYWDAPLEGWGSRAAWYGDSTLLCNVLLVIAFMQSYRGMLALKPEPSRLPQAVLIGRIVFGAWMVLNSANYLFLSLWPAPAGHQPLAIQLMDALVHSRLLDVAMVIQLVTGALILAGLFVPLALCVLMPITSCALFWSVILEQQPLGALLALVAFAANGLLMLAYLPRYQGALQRSALAFGETAGSNTDFATLFVNASGRSAQAAFIPAVITLAVALAFYAWLVTGRTAYFCMLMVMYPAFVLLARRLRDMGQPAVLAVVPLVLSLAAFAVTVHYISLGAALDGMINWIALAVAAVFALWGCLQPTKA